MNNIFGGYTGAGYMYGGSSESESESEKHNSGRGSNFMGGYSSGEHSEISSNNIDAGSMSDDGSGFSGDETIVASIDTNILKGGAIQNKKDFNQSWFIEKHRQPNKSKSRDYNKYEELVEIIYEALKSQN